MHGSCFGWFDVGSADFLDGIRGVVSLNSRTDFPRKALILLNNVPLHQSKVGTVY